MSLVAGIAPVVASLLVCAIAYLSVRRGHRKVIETRRKAESAAE
ncbi:MAG TPA: hypothetical protein VF535_03905 [Allosphingosinicella sp.]|jgi:hypothetical protein